MPGPVAHEIAHLTTTVHPTPQLSLSLQPRVAQLNCLELILGEVLGEDEPVVPLQLVACVLALGLEAAEVLGLPVELTFRSWWELLQQPLAPQLPVLAVVHAVAAEVDSSTR